MATPPPSLGTEYQQLAVRQLQKEWSTLNWSHFRERLQRPSFGVTTAEGVLARWVSAHRLIEFSSTLLVTRPWWEVVEVLKHEVAHQWVDEVLGGEDEPHGPKFRSTCAQLGIDARASGLPEGAGEEPRVLDRIRRLLTLATSDNVNEAEAAMKAARKLMLEHNLAEVEARAARGYVHGYVGGPTGRRALWQRILCNLLTTHFFVEGVYVPTFDVNTGVQGSIFEILGTEANVKMAQYVYAFLDQSGERLYRDFKRRTGAKGDKAKRDYLAGVMRGFSDKLEAEKKQLAGTGLVWRGDPGLGRFMRTRHPRLTSSRGGSVAVGSTYAEGREAGRSLVLNKPVTGGGGSGGAPKRLGRGG